MASVRSGISKCAFACLPGLLAGAGIAHALPPTSAGSPDPTFGTNGVAITNVSPLIDQLAFGALQPDGKLVAAGNAQSAAQTYTFAVVRYLDNGTPDPAFAVNGTGLYGIDTSSFGSSAVIAADGRIYVIGGTTSASSVSRCAVLRLQPNGEVDNSYGVNGVSRIGPSSASPYCYRGVLQPDGKLLLAGGTNTAAFVARLREDGTPDPQFGDGQGVATVQGSTLIAYNIALGPAGRIAVFGIPPQGGNPGVVAVLQATGAMDTSFNGNGIYNSAALFGPQILDGKFLADGRLVVTGNSPGQKPAVFRFNANGTPDTTFGTGGMAERMIAPLTGGWGRSIVVQPDGKYVIGIRSLVDATKVRYSVLRLNANGSTDTGFGTGGQTVIETGNTIGDYVYGTELGADGKIWLTGTGAVPATSNQAFMVARVIGAETTTAVTEFYNSTLDHYFITADPAEATAIDAGAAGPGWSRTGKSFKSGGPSRVCRFYGSPEVNPATGARRGPNGHFYTIDPTECAAVKTDAGWKFESYDFSGWPRTAATCAAGTVPVYRAYNGRFAQNDSNHRYTTDQAVYNGMLAAGWSGEGAVFCAPQ